MNRAFIAVIFTLSTAGLSLFFWQKQVQNYNFSLEKEKSLLKNFRESTKEYKKSLPKFEISDEFTKEFEKFRLEKYGTTTPNYDDYYKTSTSTKEELQPYLNPPTPIPQPVLIMYG